MLCGFSRCAFCVDAEFVPVITVVADEIGDFAKGLVCHDVLEWHGSGAVGWWCGRFVGVRVRGAVVGGMFPIIV